MPLLGRTGATIADRWVRLDDEAPAPADTPVIVSLARLGAEPALLDRHELGVVLPAGDDLAPVLEWLPRLALVCVVFPGFRDGRGFTATRALRERHHFTGEIRATGHILPDQYVALLRCGVSTIELPEGSDVALWSRAWRLQGQNTARPLIRRMALPFQSV